MHAAGEKTSSATFRVEGEGKVRTFVFEGQLDSTTVSRLWDEVLSRWKELAPRRLVIDARKIDYVDGTGTALLIELRRRMDRLGGDMEIQGLRDDFQPMLDYFGAGTMGKVPKPREEQSRVAIVGEATAKILDDLRRQIAFIGELIWYTGQALLRPMSLRWGDTLRVVETAGVNALPIIVLLGFLIGLILAFQSAIPLKQFGAELFVADLVAISLIRELGPLITAIILAGRSGSAFAAEIGTMKVNEEVNALNTMGLAPVRFLVVPRVLAAVFVTPLLTLFTNLAGLVGGAIVVMSLGFPLITYVNQVTGAINAVDLAGGLFKAFIFGILIASVGCMRGLQTKAGALAVGESTTRSVVTGIILIIFADGIFSVLFYYLGI